MVSEVFTMFESGTVRIHAGFRSVVSEAIAGFLVEIEFILENKGETPFYLAVGMERAALRPMLFSFAVSLEKANVKLDDPAETIPNLGGPVGVVRVERDTSFRLPLLLNEFARLERLTAILSPGQSDWLHVVCRRPLPLADQESEAIGKENNVAMIEGALQIRVRRDDTALATRIAQVADDASTAMVATGEREQALMKLIALRIPSAKTYLQSFADNSDPGTQMLARRGLAALNSSERYLSEET